MSTVVGAENGAIACPMTREPVADAFVIRPRRVLLVDDSKASAALERLLTMLGHHAASVAQGSAAITTFRSFDPDVVIIDLGLPDMDGCDLAQEIRSHGRRRTPLLIAFTGWDRPEDFARTAHAGFHHHLVKPCSIRELDRVITSRAVAHACRRRTDTQPASIAAYTCARRE